MAEKDLPSSSDESDEDFVPEGEPSSDEGLSSPAHSEDNSDEDKGHKSRKRRKLSKKRSNKVKDNNVTGEEDENKVGEATNVDALWADFKEDVNKMEKQIASNQVKTDDKPGSDSLNEKCVESKSASVNAGSGDKRRRSLPSGINSGGKLGLNKILNQLGKKDKMSTLAKSRLDWNNFKKSEGIEEEIKMHNKGKDGYLEKQDFLQRTDLRQFEIEKQLRASKRHF